METSEMFRISEASRYQHECEHDVSLHQTCQANDRLFFVDPDALCMKDSPTFGSNLSYDKFR